MANLKDLSLPVQLFLKAYRFRVNDPIPWASLKKPLSESKVALITTAGFYLEGQTPFDEGYRGGDPSFREIPHSRELIKKIKVGHRSESFDHLGIEGDPNLALPLEASESLLQKKKIGSLNSRHFSFMGSITAPMKLVKETAPRVVALLKSDGVDVAFLTPV
ncbi:MAG: glycine/sarcosine/betaine reductase selenoprotein B family protein [Planctomycetota bacterium]